MEKIEKIWKPIEFNTLWKNCDTSILDDLSASWFSKREKLKDDSVEYIELMNRLKREHAIETGIIEKLYSLDIGITETFIKEGFKQSYLSHNDTNIPEDDLMNYLNDHEQAINWVFDVTIHPFEDGNGRMARLLASLIFIKHDLFPFTVNRTERATYIKGLEQADKGEPQALVDYFAAVQKKNIAKALDVELEFAGDSLDVELEFAGDSLDVELEFAGDSLEAVQDIFAKKVVDLKGEGENKIEVLKALNEKLEDVYRYCKSIMENFKDDLNKKMNENAKIDLKESSNFNYNNKQLEKTDFMEIIPQIENIGLMQNLKKSLFAFVEISIRLSNKSIFKIKNKIELSADSETVTIRFSKSQDAHSFSLESNFEPKKKNIKKFMEEQLTIELAKIVKQL